MSFLTFSLSDIISAQGEEPVKSFLSSFKCSLNPEAEEFLKNTSVRHERRGISRTYLMIERDDVGEDFTILGYYTLAIKCFVVNEEDEIPRKILTQMNVNRNVAQSYLFGQLAKADGAEKGFGRIMMDHVIKTFETGYRMFGCRTIRLDCRDEPGLVKYYESQGFVSIGRNHDNELPDGHNNLITLVSVDGTVKSRTQNTLLYALRKRCIPFFSSSSDAVA